jgi:O-antigen/teichoic acid export membrane protein
MIEHFQGLAMVAVYVATYNLVFPGVVLVASVINLMGYPRIMRAHEVGDTASVQALLRQQVTVLLALLVPVVLGAFLLVKPLELVLPQGRYLAGVPLLPYVMLGAFLNVLRSTYVDLALHITHAVKWLVISLLVALLVGIGSNAALLPSLGIEGAAFSLCICYASALAMSLLVTRRRFRLPMPGRRDGVAIVAGAVFMAIAIRLSPTYAGWVGLIASVVIGGVAYLLVYGAVWLGWRRTRHLEAGV